MRLKYRYRGWVGRLILLSYLTPASLLFIPISVIVARLQLGNTRHGLILIYLTFAAPLSIWLLMGFFRSIPADLEEQRPTAPGPVTHRAPTLGPRTGRGQRLHVHRRLERAPAGAHLHDVVGHPHGSGRAPVPHHRGRVPRGADHVAGAVTAAVPVMVLYYLAQRFMVQGLAAGSVKG